MARKKRDTLKITLVRSVIGQTPKARATVRGMGLTKVNQTVEQADTPGIRGMIDRVSHLVEVED